MSTTKRTDLLVGFTGIFGFLGLATILFLFGEIQFSRAPTYPLTLALDEARGLETGAAVTLNGVPVGRVESLATADDPRDGVIVATAINQGQDIPRAIEILITSDLVGNTTLSIRTLPRGEGEPGLIQPGETFTADAQDLIDRIASVIDDRFSGVTGSLDSLDQTAASVTRLADTYTRVGENLELMLDPDQADPDNANTEDTQPNIFRTVARIERAVQNANRWLGDENLQSDVSSSVADARRTFDEIQAAAEEVQQTARNISTRADTVAEGAHQAVQAFIDSARRLDAALDQAQTLLAAVNAGEGTAGLLARNPDLYRNINDASIRLERMLEEFELLLRKYRTEGIDLDL